MRKVPDLRYDKTGHLAWWLCPECGAESRQKFLTSWGHAEEDYQDHRCEETWFLGPAQIRQLEKMAST